MFLKKISNKILSLDNVHSIVDSFKQSGRKIVFTNGCFDILHPGHLKLLKKAKTYGEILMVGINSDSSVKILKGEKRPIISQKDRLLILASLKIVDFVIIFDEETPLNLIKEISPDVIVKGGDYVVDEVVGADYVKKIGGEIKIVKLKKGYSTTNLIDKFKK